MTAKSMTGNLNSILTATTDDDNMFDLDLENSFEFGPNETLDWEAVADDIGNGGSSAPDMVGSFVRSGNEVSSKAKRPRI
jgi:hypothetical protein